MHSYGMLHATGGWQDGNQPALFSVCVCFLETWLVAGVGAADACESAHQQLARVASLCGSHMFQNFCFSDLVSLILGEQQAKKSWEVNEKYVLLQNCLIGTAGPAESFRQDLVLGKILVFGAGHTSSGSCQMPVLLEAALSPLAKTGMVSVVTLRLPDPPAVGKM